ncbi:MAG TPA: DUF5668 domain-containing protein [Thermoanaerobaculia bacterium]|jgi:hypothetical protein|nr:DUF5668 domain-containing protein [Thermoanaerobaculia bacterium]
MTRNRNRDNPWGRLVGGLTLLFVGIIFWLDHLGRIDAHDYFRWWPLFFVAFGLAHLPQRRWIAAAIYVVLGLALLPPIPFLPHLRLGEILGLWPLLISAGGLTLASLALRPAAKDAPDSGAFNAFAWMGGSGRTIAAENFVGGDAVAVMGGCEIDLANAKLQGDAVIDTLTFWGGIEILVPRGWRVESSVTALLGGVSNRTDPVADGPRLLIRGAAIMGGVEVRHPKEATR